MARFFRKPRFLLVYPLVGLLFVTARITEPAMRAGALMVLLGELIRLWANGYVGHRKVNRTARRKDEPKIGSLITNGPYAYIRHPLYLGSLLIGAGFCIIGGRLWVAVAALVVLLSVYRRKILEEELTLLHEYGKAFEEYRSAVPRYLPTWRRYAHPNGSWSWSGIVASKELKTVAWLAVTLIALYFWEEWLEGQGVFAPGHRLKHLSFLMVAVALMAGDITFEVARKLKRRPLPT